MTQKRSKAHRARTRKIREFCVVHPDGRISDTELHEPVLDQGDNIRATEIGKGIARQGRKKRSRGCTIRFQTDPYSKVATIQQTKLT
jgi:hypothetical protein